MHDSWSFKNLKQQMQAKPLHNLNSIEYLNLKNRKIFKKGIKINYYEKFIGFIFKQTVLHPFVFFLLLHYKDYSFALSSHLLVILGLKILLQFMN